MIRGYNPNTKEIIHFIPNRNFTKVTSSKTVLSDRAFVMYLNRKCLKNVNKGIIFNSGHKQDKKIKIIIIIANPVTCLVGNRHLQTLSQ